MKELYENRKGDFLKQRQLNEDGELDDETKLMIKQLLRLITLKPPLNKNLESQFFSRSITDIIRMEAAEEKK